jgi:hypothetical protein
MLKFQTALKQGQDSRKNSKVNIFLKKITFYAPLLKNKMPGTFEKHA